MIHLSRSKMKAEPGYPVKTSVALNLQSKKVEDIL